jgi:tetratricopeptide (TPR) repeat protein
MGFPVGASVDAAGRSPARAAGRASSLDEDQFRALLVLGFLFRRLGLNDKARRLYRALLALRPDHPDLLAPAAAAALGDGRGDEALSLLDRLEAAGGSVDLERRLASNLLRAQALAALDRPEEARVAAHRYLEGLAAKDGARTGGDRR